MINKLKRIDSERRTAVAADLSEPGGHRGEHRERQRRRKDAFPEQQSVGVGHVVARSKQRSLQCSLSGKRSASYFHVFRLHQFRSDMLN